jgi:hypothetical protein
MTRVCGCSVVLLVFAWFAPAGAAAAAGLPVGHAKGVSVQVGRHGVNFRFAKRLDPTVAALLRPRRRVELSCTDLGPLKIDGKRTSSRVAERVRLPERLTPLRLPTSTRPHPSFCTMRLASTGIVIVDIPVTQDGAIYIDERHTLFGIRNAVFTAASDAEDAGRATFEPADQFVDRYGFEGDMLVLATPDASPPDGTIGIFSDGAHHFEAVALTSLGRRMFYDINGDVLTTNGTPYLTDPDGAQSGLGG